MARPKIEGLKYFPLDCVMDSKVEMLIAAKGAKGFAVYVQVLQQAYQNERVTLDLRQPRIATLLAHKLMIEEEEWRAIVREAVDVGLFDRKPFEEEEKLTSNGMRKRVAKVIEEREKDRERIARFRERRSERGRKNKPDLGCPPNNTRTTEETETETKTETETQTESETETQTLTSEEGRESDLLTQEGEEIRELLRRRERDFASSWEEWKDYCIESGITMNRFTLLEMLRFLRNQPNAVECIALAIRKGWKGLYPARADQVRALANAQRKSTDWLPEMREQAGIRHPVKTKTPEPDPGPLASEETRRSAIEALRNKWKMPEVTAEEVLNP